MLRLVAPEAGGAPELAKLHEENERSGAGMAPREQFPLPIYSVWAKLLVLISANLLAIDPFKAYVEAKRAPKTNNFVIYFIF